MNNDLILKKKIILTLDAGGTNFVFSALHGGHEVINPITTPSYADNLEACLANIISGFEKISKILPASPDAISFAFPGPADYEKGIIGDLPNFPAFKGGVPLGPILENKFKVPVFINNDGNLFAYGEALAGFLPELNEKMKSASSNKIFKNLIGITLGTGCGAGLVLNGQLIIGDNSCGAEIHNTPNRYKPEWNAEESVSTRAIQRVYSELDAKRTSEILMPKEIFEIGIGSRPGDRNAALESFRQFGEALGNTVANVVSLFDGIVVLGGGLSNSWQLFAPAMFKELNRKFTSKNEAFNRLSFRVFNLEDEGSFEEFAKGNTVSLKVPGTHQLIEYDAMPRFGVGLSRLGASRAISIGAYQYAINNLNK